MTPLVGMNALSFAALLALTTTDGPLDGAKLELYQNNLDPSPTDVIGDYTIADYTGHAVKTITWLAPSISDDGIAEVVGTAAEFRPTGTTIMNTIFGVMLEDGAGALMGASKLSNAGLPMQSALNSILLTVRIRLNPLFGYVVLVS